MSFYHFFHKVFNALTLWAFSCLFRLLKPKSNKIVFCSFFGKQFNAQPKMIYDELMSRNIENLDVVWILDNNVNHPDNIRTARPKSLKALYELSTAKVWIDNARKDFWIKKKRDQFYIQTWHGPVCIKTVEADCEKMLTPVYVLNAKNDSKNADYIVAETNWRAQNIKTAFWYNGEIIKGEFKHKEYDDSAKAGEKVKQHFGIKKDERIALYVPTFRNNDSTNCYNLDFSAIIDALKRKTGYQYRFIVRLHPNIIEKQNTLFYNEDIINGTPYPSVDELIASADLIISDYSGCIFEGYRAKKIVLLFATDVKEYLKDDRNFYFDINHLPSPLAHNNAEFVDIIHNFDYEDYDTKRTKLIDELGYYAEDASKLVVDKILKRITER